MPLGGFHSINVTEVAFTGPDHLAFPGSPAGLKRAVANLVDNPVKYGVRPAISLRVEPGEVVVTVCNEGPGLPLQHLGNGTAEQSGRLRQVAPQQRL